MVCVANEVKVECVVQDGTEKTVSNSFTLPASTTIDELYKRVSEYHKCESDSFELMHHEINLPRGQDMTLIALDPNCLNQTVTIMIKITDQTPKQFFTSNRDHSRVEDEFISLFSKQQTECNCPAKCIKPVTSLSRTADYVSSQPEKNYVGLVNQAMTCYLNSLLQALYMTPEFRNALYNWEYVDGSEKDQTSSIPYQLQKLFLNLQTSTKPAVETTSLTKSFGWDSSEAWQQHDIQELCRVMFDALETKFKDTEQSDLINRLYEGKMIDYVKCLECKTEKTREDTFLDIPLPVRPFESTTAYESVEDALTAFVKYETLDGNNQYHCEKCNKKCDAHKGLKFTKFPYILTLHLKRFDFDYKTLFRMKLNDRVTFPDILNLNSFIDTSLNQESPCVEEDAGKSVKFDDTSTSDSGTLEDDSPPCDGAVSTSNHSNNHDQENDEGIDMSNGASTTNGNIHSHDIEKNCGNCSKVEGPYVYELFSIMIHNGGASGGHYYAYIKDFTTNQWLCFNDTTVNPITESHIERVYGGGGPTKSYTSSTNAYMLMYRQIDPSKNASPMQEENFPQHIKTLLQKINKSEDDDKRYDRRFQDRFPSKIRISCDHPKTQEMMIKIFPIGRDLTCSELKEKAYKKFNLLGDVDLDQCRLVFYDSYNLLIVDSMEGKENLLLSEIFNDPKSQPNLLLEIRRKNEQFETIKPNGIQMLVYVIDVINKDIIDGPFNFRGYNLQTGRELKQQLSKKVKIDPQQMSVFMSLSSRKDYQIFEDDKVLNSDNFTKGYISEIFVTALNDIDVAEDTALYGRITSLIKSFHYITYLYIQLPNIGKDYTEELKSLALEEPVNSEKIDLDALLSDDVAEFDHSKVFLKDEEVSVHEACDDSKSSTYLNEESLRKKKLDEEKNPLKSKTGLESTSEDSSLSDSEKTLVDDSSDNHNNKFVGEIQQFYTRHHLYEESNYYFKVFLDTSDGTKSMLKIIADKRMSVEALKKRLEKIVGVSVDSFNITTQNSEKIDFVDLNDKLDNQKCGYRFSIMLGRARRKGELKLKLYLLNLSCPEEPYKFMFNWFVSEDTTVAQAKEEIIAKLKRKENIEIPFERLRLWSKMLSYPYKVLLNNMKFQDFYSEDVLIIQELQENETVTEPEQIALFVRLWSRSTLELQPFQEVVLNGRNASELIEKIGSLSNIPENCIEIVRGKGNFPCENTNFLNLDTELDWETRVKETDSCSIQLASTSVILYRNSSEPLKHLSAEEKVEFMSKEKLRLSGLGIPSYYNHRKEKPLKIYLDSD